MGLFKAWLAEATEAAARPNPNSFTLATVDDRGRPAARVVLLKSLDDLGFGVFYTHYESPKGKQLGANPQAAGVLHFDRLGRQIRVTGRVIRSPAAESDGYFSSRPFMSQLNAWVSRQSQPISHPDALMEEARRRAAAWQVELVEADGALEPRGTTPSLPRPPNWGGYRFWFEEVELWSSRSGRFHHRLRYLRSLARQGDEFVQGEWSHAWLQP